MDGEKKPKKRGRKPKNNSLKSGEGSLPKKEMTKNLIIKLKKNIVDEYNISSYNKTEINNQCINCDEVKNSEVCWNCCHKFNEHIFGIPLKYHNDIFYIYGDFCSLECAARYSHDELKENDFSEIFSLINLYSNIIYGRENKIEMAPHRLLLKLFGGDLTIEEYRLNNSKNYDIRIPPILPIKHLVNQYETNKTSNKNMLKLYRKKPLLSEKKSITSSMNLIINSEE